MHRSPYHLTADGGVWRWLSLEPGVSLHPLNARGSGHAHLQEALRWASQDGSSVHAAKDSSFDLCQEHMAFT